MTVPEESRDLLAFEKAARKQGYKLIAGIDEAGRGPLAGPVVAAACIIPRNFIIPDVDDSKKLMPEKRKEIFEFIRSEKKILWAVGIISHEIIDAINIFQATIQAMLQAVEKLIKQPDVLLVDGLKLPHPTIHSQKIIGGDALSQSIAAASIIAKETRDEMMREYHKEFPLYGFDRHKGYCTEMHLKNLAKHGPCPIHRRSFEPVNAVSAEISAPALSLSI